MSRRKRIKFVCPKCELSDTSVVKRTLEGKPHALVIVRVRTCNVERCKHTFTTGEIILDTPFHENQKELATGYACVYCGSDKTKVLKTILEGQTWQAVIIRIVKCSYCEERFTTGEAETLNLSPKQGLESTS